MSDEYLLDITKIWCVLFQIVPGCDQVRCVHVHVLGDTGHRVHHRTDASKPVQHGLCDRCVLLHVVWTGVPSETTSQAAQDVSIQENLSWRKEGNVLFNDTLNTFYSWLYGVRHMAKNHSVREGTCCRHIGYSFRLAARVLLYASSHRQDTTYHGLCYTSRGALAGTRNSPMGPPWRIDPTTHRTMSEHLPRSYISIHLSWGLYF